MGLSHLTFKSLLFYLLIGYALSSEAGDGLDSRPTAPVQKEEESIFDILTKDPGPSLGRTTEEKPKVVQGDIVPHEDEWKKLQSSLGRSTANDVVVMMWPRKLWKNREIPYVIESYTPYGKDWNKIKAAFRKIESLTCLKYRPKRSTDNAWIRVYRGNSCWANIGRSIGFGKTDVSVGCSTHEKLIIHELVHALGFFHEQARPDRDNYVNVLRWNIMNGQSYNFDKSKYNEMDNFGQPYDYLSIMHYTRTSWTKNGKDTLQAKSDPNLKLGGDGLSKYDIAKINAMYHCHEKKGTKWSKWSDWTPCFRNWKGCYRSKYRICLVDWKYCPEADNFGVHSIPQKCQSDAYCDLKTVDGFWGQWSSWSGCSKTCDKGTRRRSRKCDSPRPSNGGKACKGAASDTESCMRRKCRSNGIDTNFDSGMGMWKNYGKGGQINWQRGRGQVNYASGPKEDHTDGRGHYLYVSSKGYSNYKKATIISRELSGEKCLSFAYMMNGKNMGSLDVFGKTTSGDWMLFKLSGKLKGHQGKYWKHAEFNIGGPSKRYWVYFEAKLGIGPNSDIAIDDVFFDEGKCGQKTGGLKLTGINPIAGCIDRDKRCGTWANAGECHFNPTYMLKACCLTCRGMGDCNKNQYSEKECPVWAGQGECVKNDRWMWKSCCKACKNQGKCEDKNNQCKTWADEGYCTKKANEVYMWKNCCKACNEKRLKPKPKPCVNKHNGCENWSKQGECKKNRDWMSKNCCKACQGK